MNALSCGVALNGNMVKPFYWRSHRGGPGNPCPAIPRVMCWKRTFRGGGRWWQIRAGAPGACRTPGARGGRWGDSILTAQLSNSPSPRGECGVQPHQWR